MHRWGHQGLLAATIVLAGITAAAPGAQAGHGDNTPSSTVTGVHPLPIDAVACIISHLPDRDQTAAQRACTHLLKVALPVTTVSTQKDLDTALASADPHIIVVAACTSDILERKFGILKIETAPTHPQTRVLAYSKHPETPWEQQQNHQISRISVEVPIDVTVYGNASASIYNGAHVTAYGHTTVTASSGSHVTAYDNATVRTKEKDEDMHVAVRTKEEAIHVVAYDNVKVRGYRGSHVTAYDNARVQAHSGSHVTASGNARVETEGRDIHVTASGNATVRAKDWSEITISEDAQVWVLEKLYGVPERGVINASGNAKIHTDEPQNVKVTGDNVKICSSTNLSVERSTERCTIL